MLMAFYLILLPLVHEGASHMRAECEISLNDPGGGEDGLGPDPILVISLLYKRRSFSPHTYHL